MQMRFAEPPDADDVWRLIARVIDTSYATVYSPRALDLFRRYHSRASVADRIANGLVLLVEHEGRLVGTGTLLDGVILGVFVSPEGQGGGTGTAIMDALEYEARAIGLTRVELGASLTALDFYIRRGYTLRTKVTMDAGEGEHLDYYPADKVLAGENALTNLTNNQPAEEVSAEDAAERRTERATASAGGRGARHG